MIKTFEEAGISLKEFLHAFAYVIEDRVSPRSFSLLMEDVDLERGWAVQEKGDLQIKLEQEEKQAHGI